MSEAAKTQFDSEVFPAELEEIRRRREAAGLALPGAASPEEPRDGGAPSGGASIEEPSLELGLVGLSFSGGGIRSSTLSLGIVQVLARRGLLDRVDYLSTVSGGGYLGSCLSSLLNRPAETGDFPLAIELGREEPPALAHLRNGSKYLAPGGLLDKLRLPALLVRGVLLNLLAVLPIVMIAVLVTELFHELGPDWGTLERMTPPIFALLIATIFVYPFLARLDRTRAGARNRYERFLAVLLLLLVAALLLVPIKNVTEFAVENTWQTTRDTIAGLLRPFSFEHHLTWALVIAALAGLAALGRISRAAVRWYGRIVIYAIGVLGPLLLLVIFWALCVLQIDSHYVPLAARAELDIRAAMSEEGVTLFGLPEVTRTPDPVGGVGWTLRGRALSVVGRQSGQLFDSLLVWDEIVAPPRGTQASVERFERLIDSLVAEGRAAALPPRMDSLRVDGAPASPFYVPEILAIDLEALADDPDRAPIEQLLDEKDITVSWFGTVSWCHPAEERAPGERPSCWVLGDATITLAGGTPADSLILEAGERIRVVNAHAQIFDGNADWIFFGVLTALLLLNWLFFDVNLTSWHTFYRDALSRVFLLREREDGDVEPNDRQRLADLNAAGSVAPYHLLNASLNLQGSRDRSLRGREGDFFFLAKRHSGARRTGYCSTAELERLDPHLDLATAMSVSAAAAAPNMGRITQRPLVFILTLLNVRLGYWLPNPRTVRDSGRLRRWNLLHSGPGPGYLFREALGLLDERGTYVNLTDGAHIENLGIYHLLERRCRLIIAVDAEADPRMAFPGLVRLMRYARIDLGVEIELDLDPLRPNEEGLSERQWAIGTIRYDEDELGTLIYLKSSLTGSEAEYVRSYHAHCPLFPHESTADQFFAEDQFEAYRALGEHIATDLCDSAEFERALEDALAVSPEPVRERRASGPGGR